MTLLAAGWIAAIVVAGCLDGVVANWVREHGVEHWMTSHKLIADIWKAPGLYYFTIGVAVIVSLAHVLEWRAGLFVVLATVISGMNGFIKWMAGRTRPFKLAVFDSSGRALAMPYSFSPFRGGIRGLSHSTNLCFPSGHATLAFATAMAVAMLWPRSWWRWIGFVIAGLVAVERVLENAHWLSDTVGAAALGILGVHVIRWILTRATRGRATRGVAAT